MTYVGELGWELLVPNDAAVAVYDALHERGADLGLAERRLLRDRVAAAREGLPRLRPRAHPGLHAGRGGARLRHGAVGRPRTSSAARRWSTGGSGSAAPGPRRRLVSFVADDPDAMLWGGELVLRDGEPVGQVTSAAYGATVGASVGLAYLRRDEPVTSAWLAEGGFEVDLAGERVPGHGDPQGAAVGVLAVRLEPVTDRSPRSGQTHGTTRTTVRPGGWMGRDDPLDRGAGDQARAGRLLGDGCPQAHQPGAVVGHRQHRDPGLGQVPGQRQVAVPGQRRPRRAGVPVLVPEPEVPLQARARPAAAVGARRRRGRRRRAGRGVRPGVGRRPRREVRRAPDPHARGAARPGGPGQAAGGAAGADDRRPRRLRACGCATSSAPAPPPPASSPTPGGTRPPPGSSTPSCPGWPSRSARWPATCTAARTGPTTCSPSAGAGGPPPAPGRRATPSTATASPTSAPTSAGPSRPRRCGAADSYAGTFQVLGGHRTDDGRLQQQRTWLRDEATGEVLRRARLRGRR